MSISHVALVGALLFATALPAAADKKCKAAMLLGEPQLIERFCNDTKPSNEVGTPKGSFVESCKNTRQDGWVVSALCKTKSGSWSATKVNFQSCQNHSLTNLNGNLVCGP